MRALIAVAAVAAVAACGDDGDMMLGPDAGDRGEDMALIPAGCVSERSTTDRTDDQRYDQIRVVYVVPSDVTDEARDTSGQICNSVRAFATWFNAQTDQFLRFDTFGGLIDIGFVRLTKTDAEMRGTDPNNGSVEQGHAYVLNRIERELTQMGMSSDRKLYAAYYEGSSVYACGGGAYPPMVPGRMGAMYLDGMPVGTTVPCGESFPWGSASLVPNYVDYGMLHELVHSLGIVPVSAPNQHAFGHVFDANQPGPNRDLMYSPRPGLSDPGWATNDPNGLQLDLGNDDYFGANLGIELSRMSLLAPLPENARQPPGW